jgi:hypothetical protein
MLWACLTILVRSVIEIWETGWTKKILIMGYQLQTKQTLPKIVTFEITVLKFFHNQLMLELRMMESYEKMKYILIWRTKIDLQWNNKVKIFVTSEKFSASEQITTFPRQFLTSSSNKPSMQLHVIRCTIRMIQTIRGINRAKSLKDQPVVNWKRTLTFMVSCRTPNNTDQTKNTKSHWVLPKDLLPLTVTGVSAQVIPS